jgi:hypothetical protein
MHQMRISTTQISSVMLRSKKLEIRGEKCENWKIRRMKTKQSPFDQMKGCNGNVDRYNDHKLQL